MKLVDVNVLIYAVNEDAPNHDKARVWWQETLSGTETVGLTWIVILAFLRLTTNRTIFPEPLTVDEAIGLVDAWLHQTSVVILQPTQRHWSTLRQMLEASGTGGNLTSDAHLAALAVEHGAELCSLDADYGRFTGVNWTNPLA